MKKDNKKIKIMKIKTILLIIVQTFFFTALSAQTTQEQADKIVLERMSSETQSYTVYAKEDVQKEMIITTATEEMLELDYSSWIYYIRYGANQGRYLIVNESNGNLLEVDAKSGAEPENLAEWREIESQIVNFTPCQIESGCDYFLRKVDVEFTEKGIQIKYYNFEVTCDFTTVDVTHTLENGVLNITQKGTPNEAKCKCYTDVSYTINGISQDEVNVIFINGVQVCCNNISNQSFIGKWVLIAQGYYDNNNAIVINPVENSWQYIIFLQNWIMKEPYFCNGEIAEDELPYRIDEQFLYKNYLDKVNTYIYKYELENDKLTLNYVYGNITMKYPQIVIKIYQRINE